MTKVERPWKFGQVVQNGPNLLGMVIHDKNDDSYSATMVSIIKDEYDRHGAGGSWEDGAVVTVRWEDAVGES